MDPTDRPQFIEHVHKSLPLTVNDVKWVPSSARFVMIGSYPKNTGERQAELRNPSLLNLSTQARFTCISLHTES